MKMKKLVALITASALCLGMSMTVFAANNPSPDNDDLQIWKDSEVYPGITKPGVGLNEEDARLDVNALSTSLTDIEDHYIQKFLDANDSDKKVENLTPAERATILSYKAVKDNVEKAYAEVVDTLWNSPEGRRNMKEAFAENGYNIKDGQTPVVIAAGNLVPRDKNGNLITDFDGEPFYQQFYIGQEEAGVGVGDWIYVLHYNVENNTWEVIEAQVQEDPTGHNMYVNVEFKNGLSPVGFIKVMQNGVAVKVDKNGVPVKDKDGNVQVVNKGTTTTTTKAPTKASSAVTGKSPKTGEF